MRPADVKRSSALLAWLVLVELGATAGEAMLIGAPTVFLVRDALWDQSLWRILGPLVAALWVASFIRLVDGLRPVMGALATKQSGGPVTAIQANAVRRVMTHAPAESAVLRTVLWTTASAVVAYHLARRGFLSALGAAGLITVTLVLSGAAAAFRAIVIERLLDRVRPIILPNADPLRAFAASYRWRLRRISVALVGVTTAAIWTLSSAFTELGPTQVGTLLALIFPSLLVPALLWQRSLRGRTAPIERYLGRVLHTAPGSRGPSRDDPDAVEAFRRAQSLPYRLALYQAFGSVCAAVGIVAVGRRLCGFDAATAGRLLAAAGLVSLATGLYQTLLLRDVLRPLLGQLGGRHRLPVVGVRSPLGLRAKLVGFFASITILTSGLVLLFAFSPTRDAGLTMGAVVVGAALALGLVVLLVRDLVAPIRALEARADEMARGELARPVPPSGEADEIGRLTFAFEEMRRALRDKLRTTESVNVDLEREVRRRTEALEARNAELRETLEKLRRAQDDLVRTEKLASMGRLVAGIAHEINNPVNAVINTLGPLQDLVPRLAAAAGAGGEGAAGRALVAEAEDMLAVIERGATRTKAIVQALHNYSRGDEATVRDVSLARSIEDSLGLLRHRLKNVRVVIEGDPESRITGYPGQIDQVLMNLITNAAQALGEAGGEIRIVTTTDGDDVVLTVTDDGPGIPPEILPRIFDPFFTTKDVGEGSGLGLSIVHGIVERHGGRITVHSARGRGTTFKVVLPRHAAAGLTVTGTGVGTGAP